MPIYLATPSTPAIRQAIHRGELGALITPRGGNRIDDLPLWAADNGCYGNGYPGDIAYLAWLADRQEHAPRCRFATAPDVVADAAATLARSAPLLGPIRDRGYPVALVAQDGLAIPNVPWCEIDALFLGGSTAWKLGSQAQDLAREAKHRGKWLHMGRVNSHRRHCYAAAIGCDSVDGTYLAFGPDVNLPRLLRWTRTVRDQQPLWE